MKIILNLGGSVIWPVDAAHMRKLATFLGRQSKKNRFYVVVGGGKVCREYVGAAKRLGLKPMELHKLGVAVTKMNARYLSACLRGLANIEPPNALEETLKIKKPVVVLGGLRPGATTDTTTMEVAEMVDADLIVFATNVAGVYTADPNKNKKAKLISEMCRCCLEVLASKEKMKPAASFIIDPVAAKMLAGSKIPAVFLHGKDVANLERAISGKAFKGTVIPGG